MGDGEVVGLKVNACCRGGWFSWHRSGGSLLDSVGMKGRGSCRLTTTRHAAHT